MPEKDWKAYQEALIEKGRLEARVAELESHERRGIQWMLGGFVLWIGAAAIAFIASGAVAAALVGVVGVAAVFLGLSHHEIAVSVKDEVKLGDGTLNVAFKARALRKSVVPPLFAHQVAEAARSYLRRCEIAGTYFSKLTDVDRSLEQEIKTKLDIEAKVVILSVSFKENAEPPPKVEDFFVSLRKRVLGNVTDIGRLAQIKLEAEAELDKIPELLEWRKIPTVKNTLDRIFEEERRRILLPP